MRDRLPSLIKISLLLGILAFLIYKFVLPIFNSYDFQGTLGISVAKTAPAKPHPEFETLLSKVQLLASGKKTEVGVALIELEGYDPQKWNWQGDLVFNAASTYKLPVLMREAELVANGEASQTDKLCYQSRDYEPGYFGDYASAGCFTREELARRAGKYSDNTAAHILVRYTGGGDKLNQYAREKGAVNSKFYDPNVTTCSDLASLWQSLAQGQTGGKSAQNYIYPYLTETIYETGIPEGVPENKIVVHKIGILGSTVNDAALVTGNPNGDYILSVCTRGSGGWGLISEISRAVWEFELSR